LPQNTSNNKLQTKELQKRRPSGGSCILVACCSTSPDGGIHVEAVGDGIVGGIYATARANLHIHVGEMTLDRFDADDECGRNLGIAVTCRQQAEHVRGCGVVDLILGKE